MVATLYDPIESPMEGMRSQPSASANPRGIPKQLTNFRYVAGALRTRDGIVRAGNTPDDHPLASTDYCIGSANVVAGGVHYAVSGWSSTGGSTRGHVFMLNLSTGAWTEFTSNDATSKYGQTTTASFDVGRFSAAAIRDHRTSKEYIVVSLGVGYPIVIDPAAGSDYAATHQPISVPTNVLGFFVQPTFPKWFTVNDETTTDLSVGTASRFVAADQGTNPENYIRFTRDTTPSADPKRVMQFSGAVDLSDCPQLILLHDTVVSFWWDIVKLRVSEDGVTYSTVWDPEAPTGKIQVDADARTTRRYTAFPLDHVPSASRNAIAYFEFTYLASAPSTSHTFDLYGIFGSGKVPGQSFFTVSYVNGGSRAESVGLVCDVQQAEYCKNLGTAALSQSVLANDSALLYSYRVNFLNTSSAQMALGVDTLYLYRNDPGDPESRYSYVSSTSLATWTPGAPGSWAFDSGSANSQRSLTDNTPTSSKNESIVAPDFATQTIPGGSCMITLGTRLVVGDSSGNVLYSEDLNPFRFRLRQATESSGTRRTLNGEYIMQFAPGPLSATGIQSIWVVTNRNYYLSGGVLSSELTRFRHMGSRGTYYPQSVAADKNDLYFLDNSKEVIRYRYGVGEQVLTENTVADKFSALDGTATTGQYEADGHVVNQRYYLSYATTLSLTPTSRRKATPMIYETRVNPLTGREIGWLQDDPAGADLTAEWWFSRDAQLYCVAADGYVYKYEVSGQTTDQGTAFASRIDTWLVQFEGQKPFVVNRINTMAADGGATGAAAYTVTYWPDQSTQTSTALLDSAAARQWVQNKDVEIGVDGNNCGTGAEIALVYTLPGGIEITGLQVELEEVDFEPAASA